MLETIENLIAGAQEDVLIDDVEVKAINLDEVSIDELNDIIGSLLKKRDEREHAEKKEAERRFMKAEMAHAAAMTHDLYESFKEAGFDDNQAMALVIEVLKTGGKK